MRRLLMSFITSMIMLALAACGAVTPAAAPTAASQPTQPPAPTRAPTAARPTAASAAAPTTAPKPTRPPAPTRAPTADTTTPDLQTAPISMDDLQTYTYDTGLFSIDIPAAWDVEDKSTAGEVLVRWTDSAQNGVILVNLFQETQQQTEDELTALLQNYLENTYQSQPNFSLDDPQPQSDGSVLIVWSYDVELSNGATTKLLGNTFIEQRDDKISLLTTAVPDEQFGALEGSIDAILNSYTIDTSVAIGSAGPTDTPDTQTVVIGDLQTYTYDTGLFSIDIPDNWTIQDNSKPGEAIVLWTDPTENGLIVVDLFEKKQQQTEDELVDFLKNFLQKSFASQSDFSMDDPRPQSDGSILIVWSYTAEASGGIKTKLLGNSFIEQRDDKVSILTTAVPEEQFDALKESTDTIINSYTIDPSAALP